MHGELRLSAINLTYDATKDKRQALMNTDVDQLKSAPEFKVQRRVTQSNARPARVGGAAYRGVGTPSDGLPGTMIVLVPLPLLMSVPGMAEPGIVTICGEPGLPVTRPAPRDVLTPGDIVILGVGVAEGATIGGGLAMGPPTGGT